MSGKGLRPQSPHGHHRGHGHYPGKEVQDGQGGVRSTAAAVTRGLPSGLMPHNVACIQARRLMRSNMAGARRASM